MEKVVVVIIITIIIDYNITFHEYTFLRYKMQSNQETCWWTHTITSCQFCVNLVNSVHTLKNLLCPGTVALRFLFIKDPETKQQKNVSFINVIKGGGVWGWKRECVIKPAVKVHTLLHSVAVSLMLISAALFIFICKLLVWYVAFPWLLWLAESC